MNTSYALITGGSSGIGKELARIHASNGGNCVLVARSKDALQAVATELVQQYGVTIETVALDLTKPGAVSTLINFLEEKAIQVDILINNAGFGGHGAFVERKVEEDLSMIDLNIRALTELTHAIAPGMVERGQGKILNLSSTAAFIPGPLQAVYYATKAYVLSLSQALSEELRGTGVTVTALCPGTVNTGFAKRAQVENVRAFKHMGTPEHTAQVGYRAMMNGKRVAFDNRFLSFALRYIRPITPEWLVLKMSKAAMQR